MNRFCNTKNFWDDHLCLSEPFQHLHFHHSIQSALWCKPEFLFIERGNLFPRYIALICPCSLQIYFKTYTITAFPSILIMKVWTADCWSGKTFCSFIIFILRFSLTLGLDFLYIFLFLFTLKSTWLGKV
jgi:general stress protein CsbA